MKTTRYIQNGVDGNFIIEVISGAPVQAANEVERITRDGKTYERVGIGDFFVEVKTPEHSPAQDDETKIKDLVILDLRERTNGNIDVVSSKSSIDALVETYHGALKLVLSLRKAIYIKTGK